MERVDITQQWLLEGNCKYCRRSAYCFEPCKSHKERVHNFMINRLLNLVIRFFSDLPDSK